MTGLSSEPARNHKYVIMPAVVLWGVNSLWLVWDSRPPVWDMALHQSYALNYLPGAGVALEPWALSGNYPPFVHLVIAVCYLAFYPGPDVAVLANVPATLVLLWGVYELAWELAVAVAARWASLLTAFTPYLIWMSRETILDYWLSALMVASLVLLRRTQGFQERFRSLLLGILLAVGLLTKWLFAGFLFFPLFYTFVQQRVWKHSRRLVNFADALLVTGVLAGVWYLPNLPNLVSYFSENAQIGALEGEPPILSFQSLVYYLRLLEGYQLFAVLFLLVIVSSAFVWRRRLLRDGRFLAFTITGGWLVMTLLRTKDPRFTMPLLGLLAVVQGAWIQSWNETRLARASKIGLIAILSFQAYAINFGISWLPQKVVLAPGYQGSLRWDWHLYLQHYFHVLGPPRREDWKQAEILRRMTQDAGEKGLSRSIALIPDLPRFNAANFQLYSRLLGLSTRVGHPQSVAEGIQSFDGFDYVLMTERDQGVAWTTTASRALNQIVLDDPQAFRLVESYPLPNGDYARLYAGVRP